ncbi:TonB-dependent siderophore receptor [Pseudomonas sp. C27(2019)]|uniref:TonB-dependent receptor plug domain-containing protein n=1 Tax=Pseudomonas sp. C27(2019) TaxID=2604941 RepID=UPI002113F806|nr:TonB-dependent receptor [Pseudomonas sp. C27(2019)]
MSHLAHASDLFINDQAVPEVLTATHLYQPPAAVPGSISSIDRELIVASGARNITDVLRLVPGMLVVPDSGNLTTVNYHGTSPGQARRLQVLIDGRSVYRAGFAKVDWTNLPVAIEDIQRIEVFRGPNTVSYGANALLGVINIITVSAKDAHGTVLKSNLGENGIRDWYARQAWHSDRSDMRLSLSGLADNGFDKREDGSDFRDGRRLSRFNLRANHQLDERNSIDWQLAFKEGSNQINNHYRPAFAEVINPRADEQDDNSDEKATDYGASLRWTSIINSKHSISVQGDVQQWQRQREWRACDAQLAFSPELNELWRISSAQQREDLFNRKRISNASPRQDYLQNWLGSKLLGPIPLPHSCGLISEESRESRFDLELQDTYSVSDSLRLISGLSYRYDQARSQTFLNGRQRKDIIRAFSQFEWYATPHWLLQGGGMFEHDSSNGDSFSPRLAVNYLFTPAHGLRAVYSEAVRSPDMFENHADWRYRVHDLRPQVSQGSTADFFISAQGSGKLKQEKIKAYELGYNGHFAAQRLSIDIKLFEEKITRMISHRPRLESFNLSNHDHIKFYGGEFESNWQATSKDRLRLSYAHIKERASNALDQDIAPPHSGSFTWLRDWQNDWSSSLMYFAAQQLDKNDLQLANLRLAKQFNWGDKRLTVAGNLQKTLNNQPIGRTNNKDNSHDKVYATVQLEF